MKHKCEKEKKTILQEKEKIKINMCDNIVENIPKSQKRRRAHKKKCRQKLLLPNWMRGNKLRILYVRKLKAKADDIKETFRKMFLKKFDENVYKMRKLKKN